ncbi:MAG TPA: AraC family transcriptional regulator [Chthoniobacterales bacterium]
MSLHILPVQSIVSAPIASNELRTRFQRTLIAHAAPPASRHLRLIVPQSSRHGGVSAGMEYKFKPEVHLQLAGASEFQFPDLSVQAPAGSAIIVPAGLPCRHRACREPHTFGTLSVSFHSTAVAICFTKADSQQAVVAEEMGLYPTANLGKLVDLATMAIDLGRNGHTHGMDGAKAVAVALFWALINLLETPPPETGADSDKLFQVKWLVHNHLANPELSVAFLAKLMHCSPGYLSHVFSEEAGESLIQYIHQQRIARASEALAVKALSISEVAWACGFSDAGYFSRLFRKTTGLTPQAYRQKLAGDERVDFEA